MLHEATEKCLIYYNLLNNKTIVRIASVIFMLKKTIRLIIFNGKTYQ